MNSGLASQLRKQSKSMNTKINAHLLDPHGLDASCMFQSTDCEPLKW